MDELEMIREFVAAVPGPSARSRRAAHDSLRSQIFALPDCERRTRLVSWRRSLPATLAAMLILVALPVIYPLLRGGHQPSALADVLRAASQAAARQGAHTPRSGQFAYTRSEGAYFDEVSSSAGTWGALVRTQRDAWLGMDGSGRIRQVAETPVFLAPGDRARWQAAGAPPLAGLSRGQTYDKRFGAGELGAPLNVDGLTRQQLLRLENDPGALRAAIQAAAEKTGNPVGYEMLTIVGDLLSETAAPPPLRSSLYRVAGDVPGIELVGTVTDRAGRRGTAVAADCDSLRLELIFDRSTSALLAKEETLTHPISGTAAPAGTVIGYTLYLSSSSTRSTAAP